MNADPAQMSALSNVSRLSRPELLAPAGHWDCAKAAVENGADAIYFGLDRFNARMRSQNFTEADLPRLMEFLHRRGVKGYVTFNTLIFPSELQEAEQYLRTMMAAGVDAAIVQDVGICRLIRHLSPDFPIHASTQMTVTSAAGVKFIRDLGCQLVVLARECSLKEIHKIQAQLGEQNLSLPLEVFVHGALCVAYSGQCLTSESLGGRSANRGECAQACRMPYELIVDGERLDLGDRNYLLSPQDLAGLEVLPDLIQTGVSCLKIEGRLKTPEYVANVTRVYRDAIDRVMGQKEGALPPDRYNLEMAFSRGLYTGWFEGVDNQALVHARFGKKRGVYLGEVTQIRNEAIYLNLQAPLKAGDGVVFDSGHPEEPEEGGRIYGIEVSGRESRLTFGRDRLNFRRIHVGDKLWKTSDPELDRHLRQSYEGDTPKFQQPIQIEVRGSEGNPLIAIARDPQGHIVQVESTMPLAAAHTKPLTTEKLQEQLGRLGNTPLQLGSLTNALEGNVMIPVSELNRLRREIVEQVEALRSRPPRWQVNASAQLKDLLPKPSSSTQTNTPQLIVPVRKLDQLQAALNTGVETLYCEFEDPRAYSQAVERFRQQQTAETQTIWVAPPRITKPGEQWILERVRRSQADGYLVRNYDHLNFFAENRCIGDFSLNVANAIAAHSFKKLGLERLTASYDLNIQQLTDLLGSCPPAWFEITIHQHMPMFHMEHCVFCAFLSDGKDFQDCGRPCETHEVKLRDRVGTEHILQADVGCRNTVFNGTAQTGAEHMQRLIALGARAFRLEFLQETPAQIEQTILQYRQLLNGQTTGTQLWRALKLHSQLGVTRGSLAGSSSVPIG
jgi:U32 family peptidase